MLLFLKRSTRREEIFDVLKHYFRVCVQEREGVISGRCGEKKKIAMLR